MTYLRDIGLAERYPTSTADQGDHLYCISRSFYQ
jgi:hypothetical protein